MNSIIIKAMANGSLQPPTANYPKAVTNGDFTITGNSNATLVGNGSDELTKWTFDFKRDQNFTFFSDSLSLESAILTLVLTPKNKLVRTDHFGIKGLPKIPVRDFELPVDITTAVSLNLLGHYTARQILSALFTDSGEIEMWYNDDAIVSHAKLELKQRLPVYQYPVKFVCGKGDGTILPKGYYHTAINIHNPSYKGVTFRKKFAVALPGKAGKVTKFFDVNLGPDEAIEIDSPEIMKRTGSKDFVKGFAVIESDVYLDVVAVYTAAGKTEVQSIHTERVEPLKRGVGPHKEPTNLLADLIPVPDANGNFCRIVASGPDKGKLQVFVKNIGSVQSPSCITRVWFYGPKVGEDIGTDPIDPGQTIALQPVDFPAGCAGRDCHFKIHVNHQTHHVKESNYMNNLGVGRCAV